MLLCLLAGFRPIHAFSHSSRHLLTSYINKANNHHRCKNLAQIKHFSTKSTEDSSEKKTRKKPQNKSTKNQGESTNKIRKKSKKAKQKPDTDDEATWATSGPSLSFHHYRSKFESLVEDAMKLDDASRFDIRAAAQSLFDEMIEKYMVEDEEDLKPDLDIYNLLLRIYALCPEKYYDDEAGEEESYDDESADGDDNSMTMTELVLNRMEEDVMLPTPNRISYLNGKFVLL